MNKKFLIIAIAFYILAIAGVVALSNYTPHSGFENPGMGGAATGMGMIASALILCGSFFLYKYFTYNSGKN